MNGPWLFSNEPLDLGDVSDQDLGCLIAGQMAGRQDECTNARLHEDCALVGLAANLLVSGENDPPSTTDNPQLFDVTAVATLVLARHGLPYRGSVVPGRSRAKGNSLTGTPFGSRSTLSRYRSMKFSSPDRVSSERLTRRPIEYAGNASGLLPP
jgi:hypothetical protein